MSHTPGPWEAEMYPSGGFEIESATGGHDGGLLVIASRKSHSAVETMHANARLIAAAPELLEALIACATHIAAADGKDGAQLRLACAAIAKATGEQP